MELIIKIFFVIFVIGSIMKMWQNWKAEKRKTQMRNKHLNNAWETATESNLTNMQKDMQSGNFGQMLSHGISASEFGNRSFASYTVKTKDGYMVASDESYDNSIDESRRLKEA